jgi:hypothetical protein
MRLRTIVLAGALLALAAACSGDAVLPSSQPAVHPKSTDSVMDSLSREGGGFLGSGH